MSKCNRAETFKRIQEIYKQMTEGANSIDIVEYSRITWGLSNKRTYQLISIAISWLKKKTEKTIDDLRLESNIRYDKLYKKLYEQERYADAGKIQALKNKINGLEVIKIDGNVNVNNKTELSIIGINVNSTDTTKDINGSTTDKA